MYRNGTAVISILVPGGLDANRNPIPATSTDTNPLRCFLDQALPNQPVYTPDGNLVEDASAVLYFDKGTLKDIQLKIGDKIVVTSLSGAGIMFSGKVKSFSKDDLLHDRIWV